MKAWPSKYRAYFQALEAIITAHPNILIFMSDQEQADVLSPEHLCITPNAARLATEGIRFIHAYTPTAHCCPSRASFMTGVYPSRHGIFNNVSTPTALQRGLPRDIKTFSESLRQAGYRLLFAGKWHVSAEENPADRGWEELLVTAQAGGKMYTSLDEWRATPQASAFTRRYGQILRPGWGDFQLFDSYESHAPRSYEDHEDYAVIQIACKAIRELTQCNQPWVLFVGAFGPHDPFIVPRQFVERYRLDEIDLPPNYHDDLRDKPNIYRRMRQQYWNQFSETEVRDSIRHYWAYCTMVDTMFGEVLETLDATRQASNTLVVRLSDHGEYCGAHGLYLKGVPAFREAYHIPTIMRYPAGIARPGRTIDTFVNLTDFAPTFLELGGVSADNLSGRSLLPFLRGTTPADWRDAHYTQFNGVELYYSQRAVITESFKYVYNGFDFDELYDLQNDPHELVNLADDARYTAVKHDLVQRMWRFAAQEQDERIFHPYGTVAFAPWGPADALGYP